MRKLAAAWLRFTQRIASPRFFLAKAEIVDLRLDSLTGKEVPVVLFHTESNSLACTTLDVGFSPGTNEIGNELTVLYEDRKPLRAKWAGRRWRNEPLAALCRARLKLHLAAVLIAALFLPSIAKAQLLGPTPYLSFNDSPFQSITFSYFHLATMESGALNVPGVTPSIGTVTNPGGNTDSVDADDGLIDGHGTNGHSFFSGSGPVGIRFTFSAAALGNLPTHAGIVWTDGTNNIRFEAFDAGNNSLGVLTGNHADGNFFGGTAEDRFYGIINPGGISSILIQSGLPNGGGIEVDHLQYGFLATTVPEPAALTLVSLGTGGLLACLCHRHRSRRSRKTTSIPRST